MHTIQSHTCIILCECVETAVIHIIHKIHSHTCANQDCSMPLISVALPGSTFLPSPPPTYAIAGERVQLNCTIPPGRLTQQYYVSWDRSGTTVYKTRRNNSLLKLNDHYSVDPSDLSLIIDDVQFEDISDDYHCVFTVFDPNPDVMQSHIYTNMKSRDIQLKVLGKLITHPLKGAH